MSRRTVTDEEIGLIKAMLRRKMRNRDIQFYFNRQDRPVNSGRITNIRKGQYGPGVPEASEAALKSFLKKFKAGAIGVAIESEKTLTDKARTRFVRRKDGCWHLADGETSDQECKADFNPKRMEPIIRAIAAMANNRGGFIFVGVQNGDNKVIGLPDTTFQDTDIVRITDKVKSLLTPPPIFSKDILDFDGKLVGVIHVEKHPHPPVIVCRDADGLEDGTILFRYPGQSSKIKFGDLLSILRERDRTAQRILVASASRLSEIGPDRALIVDTEKGEVSAGERRITIDRSLAEQLEFIREGEFDERTGATALRLVGDVQAVDHEGQIVERIEWRALSPDAVLMAYLNREAVRSPIQYVCLSALVQRQWLPLFYFVQSAGMDVTKAIAAMEEADAAYKVSKTRALERLRGKRSAFSRASGATLQVLKELQAEQFDGLRDRFTDIQIVRGIQALPKGSKPMDAQFDLLKEIYGDAGNNAAIRSGVFKAAARLDELEAQLQIAR